MDHKGRIALVCGASKGLGKACAEALLRDHAEIIICSRDRGNLEAARRDFKNNYGKDVLAVPCNLSQKKDIRGLFHLLKIKKKPIHILINNTGGPKPGNFFEVREQDWESAHAQLLLPIVRILFQAIPIMKAQKFGRIINITSMTVKEPRENLILSNVYRSGVVSLAKTLSRDLAKDNIFINNVCPGAFNTERMGQLLKSKLQPGKSLSDAKKELAKTIPLGRLQEPKELGEVVSFLASEECTLTGTTIPIDGGAGSGLF